MLRIHPSIDFSISCPSCHCELEIKGISIPNLHSLANAVCPTCDQYYYADLPVGQALWSPVVLNQSTAEILEFLNFDWFSRPLQDGFLNQETIEVFPVAHKFFASDRIIIVNCLDYLYGHSLLKLLNVQRYLDDSPELGCCVLVPTQLMHLVPKGVAEIWEFPVPIKSACKWYPSLSKWINDQISYRKECFLSKAYSHPSNRIYDLNRFVQDLPDISYKISEAEPVVLFSYREDRCWGKGLSQQQRNLQRLYDLLAEIFPDMLFVLVGFGKQNQIKQSSARVVDLRADKFDLECDRLWMAYMKISDCAVGVHGSNMLLPSGLAKSTVELVYTSRLGNTVQDFLFSRECKDPRDALLYYRMIYGNDILSDIYPSTVCDVIANTISFARTNSAWFKVGEENQSFDPDMSSKSYLQSQHYFLNKARKPFLTRVLRKFAQLVLTVTD